MIKNLLAACLYTASALTLAQTESPSGPLTLTVAALKPGYSSLDGQLFYQLLLAELSLRNGEAGTSYALILEAARRTGKSELYQRAVEISLQSRAADAAMSAARAWIQARPNDAEAHRYALQILIAMNRLTESGDELKASIATSPANQRQQLISTIHQSYARVSDKAQAAKVVEQALGTYLSDPTTAVAAWTTLGYLRLLAEDAQGAAQAVNNAQAVEPHAESAALLALELLESAQPQAEAQLRKYLTNNTNALTEVRMGYARTLLDRQRYTEASVQLQIITREKPDFAEGWLVLGALQLHNNQLALSKSTFLHFIQLVQQQNSGPQIGRTLAQAYLSLAQIADRQKDYAGAEAWLKKIENSQDLVQAQTRRASLLAKQGQLPQAQQLIRQLPERNPGDARMKLTAELDLLRELKQYKAAYELLDQAASRFPSDIDLIYDQAMMADKLNAPEDMERLLRQVIELQPDYHHAYNALGFSLAERNIRLPEAKALIQKALEFAPDDPFIQDSLGWVEFRLGNHAQALQILSHAYQTKPDPEIAAHLGEVLQSDGQYDKALTIWKEGLLLNPENEALQATLKRLDVKL